MKKYINLNIIENITGYKFDLFTIAAIFEYISSTGAADILLSPSNYISIIRNMKDKDILQGRTEDDRPFFSYYGIKIVMLSIEDAAKYEILL